MSAPDPEPQPVPPPSALYPLAVDEAYYALGTEMAQQVLDGPWNRTRALSALAGFAAELATIAAAEDPTEAAWLAHGGGTLFLGIWEGAMTPAATT